MDRVQQLAYLNQALLNDLPQLAGEVAALPGDDHTQRRLFRALMNVRPAELPLDPDFLAVQDEFLSAEREAKGVVDAATLPDLPGHPGIALWQGDITRLRVDAIVNAANRALLGCFHPCHGCIDNAIHSAAGLQLRDACQQIMRVQGCPEPAGRAKLTKGYNLPARYVIHTVGPIVRDRVTGRDREELASCYRSCLDLAAKHGLESVAFCCISTGEFHFPNREAAGIAVGTVLDFLRRDTSVKKVIFNVFKDIDADIYRRMLGAGPAAEGGER